MWLYPVCATLGLLALLWAMNSALAQAPQGDKPPEADISGAATVASRINYQGELREGGVPVTGNRTMTVRTYLESSCTTPLQTIALGPVAVMNGRFSVAVSVPHDLFNGRGVWLRLQVGSTLMACQELLPAPYALSLRPGAIIEGVASGSAAWAMLCSTMAATSAPRGDMAYVPRANATTPSAAWEGRI
jgi:hypothetical protein